MLLRTLWLLKKRSPPMGYSRKDLNTKLSNPRASKPWRDRKVMTSGNIEVTSNTDVLSEDGGTVLGNLTSTGPLGMRSPHVAPGAASEALSQGQRDLLLAMAPPSMQTQRNPQSFAWSRSSSQYALPPSSSEASLLGEATESGSVPPMYPWGDDAATDLTREVDGGCELRSSSVPATPYGAETGIPHAVIPNIPSLPLDRGLGTDPLTTIPFGKALDLNVESVHTHADSPTPMHLQHLRRTRKEVADSIMLPRHINKLFHKIMGWSEDLAELEAEKATAVAATADAEDATAQSPQLLRKKMANMTEKMKYGVLLDDYEKDKFCIEHQLELAGNKMERKFLEWEGVHVLDQDPSQEMDAVRANKSAIVMEAPSSFHIPIVNKDCCPGCGALLQDKSEEEFGFVARGEVERFILERQQKAQARSEYAARMAELQAHWEKHSRQVGEEWLDFMTQEEFDAFYRDRRESFVCHRCHALENLGVRGRRKVWSAPDFTEKLRALKEKKCVVVLVVDVTDFPGSMVYDLPGLISMNNDVIIAVNKMDCVRPRSFKYDGKDRAVAATLVSERYVQRWVHDIACHFGLPKHQIKSVVPISAKRGWNVDKLIAAVEEAANLNLRRPHAPLPTYFVGVANVGKSSVINAMAHHLYVPQPPHPQSKKVYFSRPDQKTGEEKVFWRWYTPPNVNQAEMIDIPSRHDKKASKLLTVSSLPGTTVSMNAVRISFTGAKRRAGKGKNGTRDGEGGPGEEEEEAYIYDTPGLLPHWHARSPLTLLQMRRTLIRKFRNPQCYLLTPGHTLFLGGLAAIDVVKGPTHGLLMMVYTSQKVRNGIIRSEASDAFWREQLGKALDPPGSYEQLEAGCEAAPTLSEVRSYLFECYGRHRRRPKADVYVCGLGWVSFCVSEPADVVLRVRTLLGVIHGIREPLRYNDLRAFRHWPKLKRRFTSKGVEDLEDEVDRESIGTVMRLVSGMNGAEEAMTARVEETVAGAHVKPVAKAYHPHHQAASAAPFESLLKDLESTGKL